MSPRNRYYECNPCGHVWDARLPEERPTKCPACAASYPAPAPGSDDAPGLPPDSADSGRPGFPVRAERVLTEADEIVERLDIGRDHALDLLLAKLDVIQADVRALAVPPAPEPGGDNPSWRNPHLEELAERGFARVNDPSALRPEPEARERLNVAMRDVRASLEKVRDSVQALYASATPLLRAEAGSALAALDTALGALPNPDKASCHPPTDHDNGQALGALRPEPSATIREALEVAYPAVGYGHTMAPETREEIREKIRAALRALSAPVPGDGEPALEIEIRQHDWIPGFAAYAAGSVHEGPAKVVLNVGALMAAVDTGDLEPEELPYLVAESLMHEVIHALEDWAGVEFSEDRVEALLTKYCTPDQPTPDSGE